MYIFRGEGGFFCIFILICQQSVRFLMFFRFCRCQNVVRMERIFLNCFREIVGQQEFRLGFRGLDNLYVFFLLIGGFLGFVMLFRFGSIVFCSVFSLCESLVVGVLGFIGLRSFVFLGLSFYGGVVWFFFVINQVGRGVQCFRGRGFVDGYLYYLLSLQFIVQFALAVDAGRRGIVRVYM